MRTIGMITVFTVLAGLCAPVAARDKSVEVNLGVLDELKNYQPPPMFNDIAPAAGTSRALSAVPHHIPIPGRKPAVAKAQTAAKRAPPAEKITIRETTPLPKAEIEAVEATPLHMPEDAPTIESAEIELPPEGEQAPQQIALAPHGIDIPPQPAPFITETPKIADLIQSRPGAVSLNFSAGKTEIPGDIGDILQASIMAAAAQMDDMRIEIRAYAASQSENESHARRLSLLRALQIRDYLIAANLDPTRIDILPLGTQTKMLPADRVDVSVKPVF